MRLVIVSHEFPPMAGGAGMACSQIARAFVDLGHDVCVVTSAVSGSDELHVHGKLSVVRAPSCRKNLIVPTTWELLSSTRGLARSLLRWTKRFSADAILAFFAIPSGYLAVRTARRLNLPVIVSLRGSDVPGFPSSRLGKLAEMAASPFVRAAFRGADRVAANCVYLQELAERFAPEIQGKSIVIGNGIASHEVADFPAYSGSGELRIIMLGRLVRRKRIDMAIRAVRHMCLRGIPARLTVVGEGPLRADLRQLADDLILGDRVYFTGHLQRADILRRLRQHDVYLMSSRAEGMSNAMLEAMACGLPVITTSNGAHTMVEESGCGIVVPQHEPQALLEALSEVYYDRAARVQMGKNALKYVKQYTWHRSAQRFADEFESLLRPCRPARKRSRVLPQHSLVEPPWQVSPAASLPAS